MRIDGQKKPAPHAFIEAMFKKISYPNLTGEIKVTKAFYNGMQRTMYVKYDFTISNETQYQNESGVIVYSEENTIKCKIVVL